MKLYFTIALRNLWQSGRRTLLLSTAIAAVTFLLVLMLALTEGISQNVIKSATTLMSGHINVGAFHKPTPSEADPILLEADEVKEVVRQHTPGLESLVDRTQGIASIISPAESTFSLIMGIDVREERSFKEVVQLAPQSAYKKGGSDEATGDLDRLGEPKTAMIFADQARRLGVGVGDPLTIRAQTFSGVANTLDVTVVAVAEDLGLLSSFAVFLPKSALRELYQLKPSTSGTIMAYLEDPDRADEAMAQLRVALEKEGYRLMEHRPEPFMAKFELVSNEDWTGQKLDVTTWRDQISFLEWILTAINTVSFIIVFVLAVIIGVGMINTLLMATRERIGEIGTMRAVGMTKRGILFLFMLEATLMSTAAATVGGALGTGTALALDAARIHIPVDAVQAILLSDTLHMAVSPTQLALSIAGIALFSGLAALWPSWRAAQMQPVDAIHHTD